MMKSVYKALTIAGSDSGAGAGIQADLKTFAAFGVYGTSVITAITAQNTRGVMRILELDPDLVAAQIDAVIEDIGAHLKPECWLTQPLLKSLHRRFGSTALKISSSIRSWWPKEEIPFYSGTLSIPYAPDLFPWPPSLLQMSRKRSN